MARLLFYLASDFDDLDVERLRQAALLLRGARDWTISAPEFVDVTDASSCTQPGDVPVRTVGVELAVTSVDVFPGTSRDEVVTFVAELAEFSQATGLDLEGLLDETYVGDIRSGVVSSLIKDGLISTW